MLPSGSRFALRTGSRVRSVVDFDHLLRGDLRVALRGGKILVAEQLLNRAQVRAGIEQMRREGMTERVRRNPPENSAFYDPLREQRTQAPRRDAPAVSQVEK